MYDINILCCDMHHIQVLCRRLTWYPTQSHYADFGTTGPTLSREATGTCINALVFDLTTPVTEPRTFRIRGERSTTSPRRLSYIMKVF